MEAGLRKKLIAGGKVLISALLLYFIFTKIPFKTALAEIEKALSWSLLLALLLFVVSKIIAALRLNHFFHQINVPLSEGSNLKLYLQGMFYNLFLPGGIGGDAYKGYIVQKKYDAGIKRVVASLLIDRISGMVVLLILGLLLLIYLPFLNNLWLKLSIIVAVVLGILLFRAIVAKYFDYLLPVFWKTLLYSFGVQLAQLLCVWFILKAFGISADHLAYLLVFLISSIVAVIPITIGGIGSRELVFYYGASYMGLQEEIAVSISILFFAITALVSLLGIYYHFKKPKLEEA